MTILCKHCNQLLVDDVHRTAGFCEDHLDMYVLGEEHSSEEYGGQTNMSTEGPKRTCPTHGLTNLWEQRILPEEGVAHDYLYCGCTLEVELQPESTKPHEHEIVEEDIVLYEDTLYRVVYLIKVGSAVRYNLQNVNGYKNYIPEESVTYVGKDTISGLKQTIVNSSIVRVGDTVRNKITSSIGVVKEIKGTDAKCCITLGDSIKLYLWPMNELELIHSKTTDYYERNFDTKPKGNPGKYFGKGSSSSYTEQYPKKYRDEDWNSKSSYTPYKEKPPQKVDSISTADLINKEVKDLQKSADKSPEDDDDTPMFSNKKPNGGW